MMSFGFHNYAMGMYGSAVVQQLLEKPDLQLDELLDEDGIQMELKTNNQRLMSFLTKDQVFRELINYVIKEPNIEEEFNQKKIYKYPFTAADILAADSLSISNVFFRPKNKEQDKPEGEESEEVVVDNEEDEVNDDTYLDELFGFLETDQQINVTSAGYFCKVVNSLFGKKTVDLLKYIFERKPQLLEKMAKKMYCRSIAEFLGRILVMEGSYISKPIYLAERTGVITSLLEQLVKSDDIEEVNNISTIICDILSKQNSMNGSQEILTNIFDEKTVATLFECLNTKNSGNVCSATIIINNMIAYLILNAHKANQSQDDDDSGANDSNVTEEVSENLKLNENSPLIKALIAQFPSVVQYLRSVDEQSTISSTYGAQVRPLGIARLKLIELISLSLKLNLDVVFEAIINCDALSAILGLFKAYEWNNMLHCQVEKILMTILDSGNQAIQTYLFEKVKLLDFIIGISGVADFTFNGNEERKIKKGFNGQIVRISNKIAESSDKYIVSQTEGKDDWQEFVKGYLAECNSRDRTPIGESKGQGDDEEKSENAEESQDIASFMQKLSKMFQNNAKFQEKFKKEQKAKEEEENDDQVEEDIHNQDNDDEEDGHHEEKEGHDDSTEESESYKHTYHLHVDPSQYYKPHHVEEEESRSPAETEYNIVNFWKPTGWHSAKDLLAELGVE